MQYWAMAKSLFVTYGLKLIFAIIVLVIGLWVIKSLTKVVTKSIKKLKLDASVETFFISMTGFILKILLVLIIAAMVGIEVTSLVAILGAFSFAVGLALQGSLSNFAGGVLILIFKPFKVGDYIEAGGYAGTVRDIQIFYTVLNTPDNKQVMIPNGNLSNSSLVNYSAYDTRRVDFTFGVGYEDDLLLVKNVLNDVINNNKLIFKTPAPTIVVGEHGDSSVNFFVRVWTQSANYWDVYFDLMEKVKLAFDANQINIPYPHMDINVTKE